MIRSRYDGEIPVLGDVIADLMANQAGVVDVGNN